MTPGPWVVREGGVYAVMDYLDLHVADPVSYTGQQDEQWTANAHLIAAARCC